MSEPRPRNEKSPTFTSSACSAFQEAFAITHNSGNGLQSVSDGIHSSPGVKKNIKTEVFARNFDCTKRSGLEVDFLIGLLP